MNAPTPVSVTIRHSQAAKILPFTSTVDRVLHGNWGIAARLCAEKASDLVGQQAALALAARSSGFTFAPEDFATFSSVVVENGAITVEAEKIEHVTGALDLYMRILCGQWSEMDFWCSLASKTERSPDFDPYSLLRIRGTYGNTRSSMSPGKTPGAKPIYTPLTPTEWPDHPHASIGIAESVLPARIAYWAYKLLGAGAPGGPTFSLPDEPLSVEIDGVGVDRIRDY